MDSLYQQIRIAIHGIWKRRWLALGVAWGVALLGWLVVSGITNTYESRASVFVQMQTMLPGKLGISPAEGKDSIETITQTLTSAENLEKVVRRTALIQQGSTPREIADQVISLRKNIEIVTLQDNLFEISAASGSGGMSNKENAELAKDIVQKLLDLFVEGNLSGTRAETAQTLQFLDGQLAQREAQLQEAEARRAEFEQRNLGLLPGVGSVSQRMDAARAELGQVDSNLSAAQGSLAAVNGQIASIPPTINTPGTLVGGGGAAGRVAILEGQISDGIARGWTENYPDMIALRNQLARARAAAANEAPGRVVGGSNTPNPLFVTLRTMQAERQGQVSALSGRRAQLQAELAQFQSRQFAEPAVAQEQQRLNRDYEVLKTAYDKLLADREEVKLRGSLQSDTDSIKFRVIEPPTSPRSPAAPNRPMLLTLVLFAAIGAGAATAFAIAQIKSTYTTAEQLQRASGLPVIGSITEVMNPAQREKRAQKLKYFVAGCAGLVGVFFLLMTVEFIQRGMVA
jgi:polysaccharide biosynthesis transport protein